MENGYLTVTHCRQKVFCHTAAMFEPALRKYSLSLLVSSEGKDAFRSTLVKDFNIRRLKVTPSDSKTSRASTSFRPIDVRFILSPASEKMFNKQLKKQNL